MSNAIVSMAAVAMAAVGITNRRNRQRTTVHVSAHDMAAVVFIIVVAAVLLYMPVGAQDIGGSQSDTLYLPQIAWTFPMWFTDAELAAAMERDGYDVDTAMMHTVCTLDVTAVPPYLIRYIECQQFYVDGQATEGTDNYILWRKYGNNVVTGVEIGGQ